jgi:vacuolar-type H+-ATPase subunit I/STV1
MDLLYRILGIIINLVGFLLAISLIVIIPVFITVPVLWLPLFIIAAVVLYTWFSNKFRQRVLVRKEVVRHSLRDWIKVNGYVTIAFSILNITSILSFIRNPASYIEATKELTKQFGQQVGQNFRAENMYIISIAMLVYLIALFAHVLWTFTLIKKHEDFFQ